MLTILLHASYHLYHIPQHPQHFFVMINNVYFRSSEFVWFWGYFIHLLRSYRKKAIRVIKDNKSKYRNTCRVVDLKLNLGIERCRIVGLVARGREEQRIRQMIHPVIWSARPRHNLRASVAEMAATAAMLLLAGQ